MQVLSPFSGKKLHFGIAGCCRKGRKQQLLKIFLADVDAEGAQVQQFVREPRHASGKCSGVVYCTL